jgi:hypothetical protein
MVIPFIIIYTNAFVPTYALVMDNFWVHPLDEHAYSPLSQLANHTLTYLLLLKTQKKLYFTILS